ALFERDPGQGDARRRGVRGELAARRGGGHRSAADAALEHRLEPGDALEPPVTEELGVVRADGDAAAEAGDAAEQLGEVMRLVAHGLHRLTGVVGELVAEVSRGV